VSPNKKGSYQRAADRSFFCLLIFQIVVAKISLRKQKHFCKNTVLFFLQLQKAIKIRVKKVKNEIKKLLLANYF
jgi:hypothetical protein